MLIPAARAGKLFGGDGGLTLTLYPAFPEDFSTDTPLFARIDGLDVPLWCERFERRGVTGAVVRFADLDTERRASELLGKELFIEQTQEEEDDEFYMEDLIGFRATGIETGADAAQDKSGGEAAALSDTAEDRPTSEAQDTPSAESAGEDAPASGGTTLKRFTGEVTDYYDSESNPLLEITTDDGTEVLIPAAEEFIARIDFEARRIEFILPEGLLNLNRN